MFKPKEIIAKFEFIPATNGKTKVNVTMPIWLRKDSSGKVYITLGLLGGMTTIAKDEKDIDNAMKEAIASFIHAAQKFGKGINEELKSLGWQPKKTHLRFKSKKSFIPRDNNPMLQGLMRTGVERNVNLQIAA